MRGAVVVAEVAVEDAERSEASVRSVPTKTATLANSSERPWMEIMREMKMLEETLQSLSTSRDRTVAEATVSVRGAAVDVASTEAEVHTVAVAMATSSVVAVADGEAVSITGSKQLRTTIMQTPTKMLSSSYSTMSKCASIRQSLITFKKLELICLIVMMLHVFAIS